MDPRFDSDYSDIRKVNSTDIEESRINPEDFGAVFGNSVEIFTIYEQKRYAQIFDQLKDNEEEFVSSSSVKEFLLINESRIKDFELIWNKCDPNRSGKLIKEQFYDFMWSMEQSNHAFKLLLSPCNRDVSSETFEEKPLNFYLEKDVLGTQAQHEEAEPFMLKDFNEEHGTDYRFIVDALKRLQTQTEGCQNILFEQAQRIFCEQKRNNHYFLQLKHFREQIVVLEKICSDNVKEIRKTLFELEDENFSNAYNIGSCIKNSYNTQNRLNTTWNPFDTSDKMLNFETEQSVLSKSINPFRESSETLSSLYGPCTATHSSSTPLLSWNFSNLIEPSVELEVNTADCSEKLSAQ